MTQLLLIVAVADLKALTYQPQGACYIFSHFYDTPRRR